MKKEKERDKNFYCIVGCGSLGAYIAKTLSAKGAEVLIIDKDKKSFKKLGLGFSGMTVEGDACDLRFLSELSLDKADALVSVTEDDNINLMVCQIAKELYGLKVIARLYNNERDDVYKGFGIDAICPEELTANAFEQKLLGGEREN